MTTVFIQIAILLVVAFIISYIIRIFKQPAILGYIITGIIVSPFILKSGASLESIQVFSEFGIAFLLFIVGLHLNPRVIKEIGLPSLFIGLGQVIITFIAGYLISLLLGFSSLTSVFVGIALAFSSTIVVMKLLSDQGQIDSLYGKISTGILIIQDLIAIAVLMIISSLSTNQDISSLALNQFIKGAILIVVLFLFGFFIAQKIVKSAAKSQELLFLFSVCWCFAIAALFSYFGFSIEIGALLAGIILSVSQYSIEISSKVRPLRDFFLIIFFVILGLNIQLTNIGPIIINALILSCAVLILKPLIIMLLIKKFAYTKRTNFLTGITLAQISEFSLIIVALGISKGYLTSEALSTITLACIITMAISTYWIIYSEKIYHKMSKFASLFESKKVKLHREKMKKDYSAILFGYNRIGFGILNSLQKIKRDYLVVDFNPDTISALNKLGIPCVYGDACDADLLEELPIKKAKLIISTIPDFEANYVLIEEVRRVNKNAVIIVRAHQINEALDLYKKGASYVLTPHFLGGEYVSKMIEDIKVESAGYSREKEKHIKMLKDIARQGHDHPHIERN